MPGSSLIVTIVKRNAYEKFEIYLSGDGMKPKISGVDGRIGDKYKSGNRGVENKLNMSGTKDLLQPIRINLGAPV